MSATPRPIELLAPARDADIAIEAIKHGADAIYMGAMSHGARSAASNTLADIERVTAFGHQFGVRTYVTLNTIIYPDELSRVRSMVQSLYNIGVDALIVQDMALLEMDLPPIALHASTQCDIRTPEKALALQSVGFSQLVVPRELSADEIRAMAAAVSVPLEAFVHGALCVSYSGDCQASYAATGRSANRGECAQICRMPFDLTDSRGNILSRNRHLLSLHDLNRTARVAEMMEAGISSFKIEGRLKDAAYVKNIVAHYRQVIDSIIADSHGLYVRSSAGTSEIRFTPDPDKSFNRGFTPYFITGKAPAEGLASLDTPKWKGEKVGTVTSARGKRIVARLTTTLQNGDGLGYFDARGEFQGLRANRVESDTINTVSEVSIPPGSTLYRNHDHKWDQLMASDTATRTLTIDVTLRSTPTLLIADASDERGNRVSVSEPIEWQQARTPQQQARRSAIEKTGGTIYRVHTLDDRLGDRFVPASVLTSLRRSLTEALDRAQKAAYRFDYRRPDHHSSRYFQGLTLTYHDNVANPLARKFYEKHGAVTGSDALETSKRESIPSGTRVMTTRYCLRRELGMCHRTPEGKKCTDPLFLRSGNYRFSLDFDCRECRMHVNWLA